MSNLIRTCHIAAKFLHCLLTGAVKSFDICHNLQAKLQRGTQLLAKIIAGAVTLTVQPTNQPTVQAEQHKILCKKGNTISLQLQQLSFISIQRVLNYELVTQGQIH
jgi:hypothetical protein